MDLQVRLLVERAAARRVSLLGLIEVIPDELWARGEPGDDWTARNHLEHIATADTLLRETVEAFLHREELTVSYERRRVELMADVGGAAVDELRERMTEERAASVALLERIDPWSLDASIAIPAAVDAFGRQIAWPLRAILTGWAEHDTGHEMAIRAAVTSPPDAASLAAAARFRR